MPEAIEFHFREFFRGETVTMLVNGEQVAAFPATTRPQIGLAHIERVAVAEGDTVTVCIAGVGEHTVDIVGGVTYWVVTLDAGVMAVEPGQGSPGYV